MNSYDEQHLSKDLLSSLKKGSLNNKEQMKALTHLSHCDDCCEAYVDCFESVELKKPLSPLNDEIIYKIRNKNQKKYIVFYELKVALSVCISLLFLFAIPQNANVSNALTCIEKSWQSFTKPVEKMEEQLTQLSDYFYKGGFFIEKTKK